MPEVDPDDWRLTRGADEFLRDAALRRQTFRKPRDDWDHEHCAFCWAKFVEPADLERYVASTDSHAIYSQGFTTTADHPDGAAYHWVCTSCFEHFAEYAGLRQVP